MDYLGYSVLDSQNITEVYWTDNIGNKITEPTNYLANLIFDYDPNTKTKLTSVTGAVRTIDIQIASAVSATMAYLEWENIANTDYISFQHSPDATTWTSVAPTDIWGNGRDSGTYGILPSTSANGRIIAEFNSTGDLYWRVYIASLAGAGYVNADIIIKKLMIGNLMNIEIPDATKVQTIKSSGITREQSFDGNVWTTILGSSPKKLAKVKWTNLSYNDKLQWDSLSDELKNNCHLVMYDATRANTKNWIYGYSNPDTLGLSEEAGYLYNLELEIKEI